MSPHLPPSAEQQAAMVLELRALLGGFGGEVEGLLQGGGEPGLDDATLMRWLRARKFVLAAAQHDLAEHAKWRAAYVPKGRILEEDVGDDEFNQDKSFLTGTDKQGHPVCIVRVKNHHGTHADRSKKYIAYALDTATWIGNQQPGWDGKLCGIFDLRGVTVANCDFATLRNVFDLLQHHYPERLDRLWLYEAPMVFYGLYKMVSPFIDPVTRSKVKLIYSKEAEKELATAFDPESLPPELGGTAPWRNVRQACQEALAKGWDKHPEAATPAAATAPEAATGAAAAAAAAVAPEVAAPQAAAP